ncbi:Beta-1,4-glucuronyltransferase 1 [Orchesella cincta]|uniref:Beta-1,4-glucuronyltransferase 1 n=1 Tax=Orchesella cincta TaxID=48709 RepID=A0A1D2N7B9_ORCCI|nr:Beta-1,4-glucuronyltransferase 1 [Orchesella cincta]
MEPIFALSLSIPVRLAFRNFPLITLILTVTLMWLMVIHQEKQGQPEFDSSSDFNTDEHRQAQDLEKDTNGFIFTSFSSESRCTLQGLLPELPFSRSRFDNKRIIRIFDYVRTGKSWENLVNQYSICLATQSSLDRIKHIPELLKTWRGPVSLAVYITNEEEWLMLNLYIRFLERCYPSFGNQVSIHLAVPSSLDQFCFKEGVLEKWEANQATIENKYQCHEVHDFMNLLISTFPITEKAKLALKEVYPQNHMRNIARKGCATDWTFSTDIDIIPSEGLAENLQEFYDSLKENRINCEKCAYVIPTFELEETQPFPKTKRELIACYESGAARQFHGKYYSTAHNATNFPLWASTNLEDGPVTLSHNVTSSQTFLYEPFYVSSDLIPPFDERFLGYGFTRNSQFQAAFYAGWNFTVLTPVFNIHPGLQTHKTVISPKKEGVGKNVRKEQTSRNYQIFKKVLKEMKLKQAEGIF